MGNDTDKQRPDFWFMNTGDEGTNLNRSWADCKRYGFVVAGGGPEYQDLVRSLRVNDRVLAYLSGSGYVGVGRITAEAVPMRDFVPIGQVHRLQDLPHKADIQIDADPDRWHWCAAIRWLYAVDAAYGVRKDLVRRPTLQPIWDAHNETATAVMDALGKAGG